MNLLIRVNLSNECIIWNLCLKCSFKDKRITNKIKNKMRFSSLELTLNMEKY